MVLTWFDFGPVSLFYSVIFILYVQISKYITNNFCSPPYIKINQFVSWHDVILERQKRDIAFFSFFNFLIVSCLHVYIMTFSHSCQGHSSMPPFFLSPWNCSSQQSLTSLIAFCGRGAAPTVSGLLRGQKEQMRGRLSQMPRLEDFASLTD